MRKPTEGGLVALPATDATDAHHMLRLVSHHKRRAVGVIAFLRRRAPEISEYEDAMVLARWGRLPDDEMADAAA